MADLGIDARELKAKAQEIKERLLKADPAEGLITEMAFLHDSVARLQATLKTLERQQRTLEAALAARDVFVQPDPRAAYSLPQQLVIEADHLLDPEDGFYSLEHSAKGQPFRWTGPETSFTFNVYVDRSEPRPVEALFLNSIVPDMFQVTQCFVDQEHVETRYVFEDGLNKIYAEIPARAHPDTTRTAVTFVLPEVRSARDSDPASSDTRPLGVAFHRLTIAPDAVARAEEPAVEAEPAIEEPARKLADVIAVATGQAGAQAGGRRRRSRTEGSSNA
jgi:hypothetical protein